MLLDIHNAMDRARSQLQRRVLEQIHMETMIRATCKSAWDSELKHSKWRPNAQTLVPTFTVTWDAYYGQSRPPLKTVWYASTACTIIPRNTFVDAEQQLEQDAQRSAPKRLIYVSIDPGFKQDVMVTLAGFHFRVDVCQMDNTKPCTYKFH